MYALRQKPVPSPALAGNSPSSERGVVLLVALIILVALTLAGVALIRSVDTANIIAGNLSFRESAVHSGESGTQAAITWLEENNNSTLHNVAVIEDRLIFYSAARADRDVDGDESWEVYWNRVKPPDDWTYPVDPAGNTVRFVIHRLCDENNKAPHNTNCAKPPAGVNTGGSFSAGGPAQIASNQVYYRITTRITGPRNTVAYLQTVVAL